MEESIVVNPDNPRAWTFGEGYPLTEVINYEGYTIGGREYYNYFVMMDGARIVGFDKPPFFLFGTDPYGRDLFTPNLVVGSEPPYYWGLWLHW